MPARGGTSGCVETGAFGKEAYILTGYLNLPKILEIALHGGVDPRTGQRIGAYTVDVRTFRATASNDGCLVLSLEATISCRPTG